MGLELKYILGQTQLEEEEKEGLMIPTITTQSELDEFEQKNIEEALQWSMGRRVGAIKIFSEAFVRKVHTRMFDHVWDWAGVFRTTGKNFGIESFRIPIELRKLCQDALYWHLNDTYPPEEIAVRFKHRIVSIHCFPNGNGRHSRFMADLIMEKIYHGDPFTWGAQADLHHSGNQRTIYIQALKAADRGNIDPLVKFALS